MSNARPASTAVPEDAPPAPFRAGHPVRNFIAVLLVAVAGVGAIWWTGAVLPRLEAGTTVVFEGPCPGPAVSFHLTNPTPFTVEVRDVEVTVPGLTVDAVEVATVHRRRSPTSPPELAVGTARRPFRLRPGSGRTIIVRGHPTDESAGRLDPLRIHVTAATPLGITRRVRVRDTSGTLLGNWNTGPAAAGTCPPG